MAPSKSLPAIKSASDQKVEMAIIKTLVYAEIFSYPLTFPQLWQRLIIDQPISQKRLKQALAALVKKGTVAKKKKYFFLPGKTNLLQKRAKREKISAKKKKIAQKAAFWLSFVPTLKAVVLTGNVAAGNADWNDDIDLFLITAPGTLWLTRLSLYLWLKFTKPFSGLQLRAPGQPETKNSLCLNLILDQACLRLPPDKRNLFVAYEIAQSQVLWQKGGVFASFLAANKFWLKKYLANFSQSCPVQVNPVLGLTWLLFPVNLLAFLAQWLYMLPKKTKEKVGLFFAFFHPHPKDKVILNLWQKRTRPALDKLDKGF